MQTLIDDPLLYDAERLVGTLNGRVLPAPLGPSFFMEPMPRAHRDPPPPTREQRDAKRATRKAERQRRKAGRRGGR